MDTNNSSTINNFLYDMFVIEDGDGLNLVIYDERRQKIMSKFEKLIQKYEHHHQDSEGNKFYTIDTLIFVWDEVTGNDDSKQ
jgi:hypothetical protein